MNAVDPFGLADPPPNIARYIEAYGQEHGGEQPWVGWWDTHQNRAVYGWYPGDDAERYRSIASFNLEHNAIVYRDGSHSRPSAVINILTPARIVSGYATAYRLPTAACRLPTPDY